MRARRVVFFTRRAVAILLALAGLWLVVGIVYAIFASDPLDRFAILLFLAVLGGLLFLLWLVFKILFGIVRFVAGSPREKARQHEAPQRRGLGAEYEEMVLAQRKKPRRWR